MSAQRAIRVARVYDDVDPDDGQRVLVDRIWPRGIRKDDPRVGTWSRTLRRRKNCASGTTTKPNGSTNSPRAMKRNCDGSPALDELRKLSRRSVVTLVTATRKLDSSQAAVLAKLLKGR